MTWLENKAKFVACDSGRLGKQEKFGEKDWPWGTQTPTNQKALPHLSNFIITALASLQLSASLPAPVRFHVWHPSSFYLGRKMEDGTEGHVPSLTYHVPYQKIS